MVKMTSACAKKCVLAGLLVTRSPADASMAERQQRQRLRALQNNRQLARFIVQGRVTGKQLGTGSYGSVEEV